MFLLSDWNGPCKDKASVDQSFSNIKQIQVNYNFAQYWLSSNEGSLSTEEEFGKTGERAQVTFLPCAALLFEMSPSSNPGADDNQPNILYEHLLCAWWTLCITVRVWLK